MNYPRVRRTLILTFFLNLCVSLAKGIVGALAGSVSMVADAVHSLFDSVSNIVGLISIYVADAPPPDPPRHQYGHGKFETIGTMVVGGTLLLITAVVVGYEGGFGRFFSGAVPDIQPLTVAVMVVTIGGVNITITLYERRVGREENSSFLLADSQHTASDILVSLSVLGGFASSVWGIRSPMPSSHLGLRFSSQRWGWKSSIMRWRCLPMHPLRWIMTELM